MSDFIGLDVKGIPQVSRKLEGLPAAAQDAVTDEVSEYILNVFQEYPPQKRVTRKQAYGRTFQSAKQRKWFFWALSTGLLRIPYKRTGDLRRGWVQIGSGAQSILANETEAAIWTMDNDRRARLNKLVGWQTIAEILDERKGRIYEKAVAAVRRVVKRFNRRGT